MKEICVRADKERIGEVFDFVEGELGKAKGVSRKEALKLHMIVDEIFSNIAGYAYDGGDGDVFITYAFDVKSGTATLSFADAGRPFDPLGAKPAAKVTEVKRKPGGLGILMVRKSVDDIRYEYKDGKNILTIAKKMGGDYA